MNLFDVTDCWVGTGPKSDKPRNANNDEVRAYLKWLAKERGVFIPHDADYGPAGIYSNARDPGGRVPLVEMPGYGARDVVTVDILNDAGEVIRTSTIGLKPNGALGIDRAAVVAMVALPPRKRGRKAKVATETRQEPQEIVSAPVAPVEPVAAPVAAPAGDGDGFSSNFRAINRLDAEIALLRARLDRVEGVAAHEPAPVETQAPLPIVRDTRPARLRVVRRYLAMRQERQAMREKAALDEAALIAGNAFYGREHAAWNDRIAQAETQAADARNAATGYRHEMETLDTENRQLRADIAARPRLKVEVMELRTRNAQLERLIEVKDKRLALRVVGGRLAA
jgi:hypothetical protein